MLFAGIGAPAILMGAGLTSLLQRASTDDQRGSAFAALGLGQAAGQAIGLLAGGALQKVIGTLPLLEVQAAAYVTAALLALTLLPQTARSGPADRHRQGDSCGARWAPIALGTVGLSGGSSHRGGVSG